MKALFLISLSFLSMTLWAQDTSSKRKRLFFQGEASFTIPSDGNAKGFYYVYKENITGKYYQRKVQLDESLIVFSDFSVNYQLFPHLSIGALAGLTHLSSPGGTAFKMGGIARFNVVKTYPANIFLQLAGFLPMSSGNNMESSMGEVRFGLSIPLMIRKTYSMHLSMYTTYLGYDMKGKNPNVLDTTEYKGIGFGYGVRF